MRESAATIKSAARGKTRRRENGVIPRDGTVTRAVFDMFVGNPGSLISIPTQLLRDVRMSPGNLVSAISLAYDLDIRHLSRGVYCLVGRWHGRVYEDFFAGVWGEGWVDYERLLDTIRNTTKGHGRPKKHAA